MVIIIVICVFLGLAIATVANAIAWYAGKKRLDVMTFLYLPIAALWYTIPLVLGLMISIAEIIARPAQRWVDTIGGRIAIGSLALFLSGWLGSLLSGLVLKYLFAWPDGPTPPPKI